MSAILAAIFLFISIGSNPKMAMTRVRTNENRSRTIEEKDTGRTISFSAVVKILLVIVTIGFGIYTFFH